MVPDRPRRPLVDEEPGAVGARSLCDTPLRQVEVERGWTGCAWSSPGQYDAQFGCRPGRGVDQRRASSHSARARSISERTHLSVSPASALKRCRRAAGTANAPEGPGRHARARSAPRRPRPSPRAGTAPRSPTLPRATATLRTSPRRLAREGRVAEAPAKLLFAETQHGIRAGRASTTGGPGRPGSARWLTGQTSWQMSQPKIQSPIRGRTCGDRPTILDRQERDAAGLSMTPGAISAPVGHATRRRAAAAVPACRSVGGRAMSVKISPKYTHDP